jgi:hypothetical protein
MTIIHRSQAKPHRVNLSAPRRAPEAGVGVGEPAAERCPEPAREHAGTNYADLEHWRQELRKDRSFA